MPQVVAGWLISSLGITSVWATAAVNIGVGLAFSAVAKAIKGGGDRAQAARVQPGIRQKFTGTGDTSPQSFILGRYATAGHQIAPFYTHTSPAPTYGTIGSGDYATFIINVSDAPVEALRAVYVDSVRFDVDTELAGAVHAQYGLSVASGAGRDEWVGRLWVKFYDGTQTAADPYLLAAYGAHPSRPWKATSKHAGGAYAIVTVKQDRTLFRGVPRFLFELDGLALSDPRDDTTGFTDNPITMAHAIMRGITLPDGQIYGLGVDAADLPAGWWDVAADECDALVARQGGGTEPQYRAGLEVKMGTAADGGDDPLTVIDDLLPACAGQIADLGGMWIVRAGAPGLSVLSLDDGDILNSQDQSFTPFEGLAQSFNTITAIHPAPAVKWEAIEAPRRADAAAVASDGRALVAGLNLDAVPYPDQVQRLMVAWLADAQRRRSHRAAVAPRHDRFALLDTLEFTSAIHGYADKLFEIQGVSISITTGVISVALRETDPADFTPDAADYVDATPATSTRVQAAALGLASFAAAPVSLSDGANDRRPGIRLTWAALPAAASGVFWELRIGAAVVLTGTVADPAAASVDIYEGILAGQAYTARATPIAAAVPVVASAWEAVTAPDLKVASIDVAAETLLTANMADNATAVLRVVSGSGTRSITFTPERDGAIIVVAHGVCTASNGSGPWAAYYALSNSHGSFGGAGDGEGGGADSGSFAGNLAGGRAVTAGVSVTVTATLSGVFNPSGTITLLVLEAKV